MEKNEEGYPIVRNISELYEAQKEGYLFVLAICSKCGIGWSGSLSDSFRIIKHYCPKCDNSKVSTNASKEVLLDSECVESCKKIFYTKQKSDLKIENYSYKGYGAFDSECMVDIWKNDDKAFVLFTDKGIGTSVTNASDLLVTEIYNNFLLEYDKSKCLFMETYNKEKVVDIIIPKWKGGVVHDVSWVRLGNVKED